MGKRAANSGPRRDNAAPCLGPPQLDSNPEASVESLHRWIDSLREQFLQHVNASKNSVSAEPALSSSSSLKIRDQHLSITFERILHNAVIECGENGRNSAFWRHLRSSQISDVSKVLVACEQLSFGSGATLENNEHERSSLTPQDKETMKEIYLRHVRPLFQNSHSRSALLSHSAVEKDSAEHTNIYIAEMFYVFLRTMLLDDEAPGAAALVLTEVRASLQWSPLSFSFMHRVLPLMVLSQAHDIANRTLPPGSRAPASRCRFAHSFANVSAAMLQLPPHEPLTFLRDKICLQQPFEADLVKLWESIKSEVTETFQRNMLGAPLSGAVHLSHLHTGSTLELWQHHMQTSSTNASPTSAGGRAVTSSHLAGSEDAAPISFPVPVSASHFVGSVSDCSHWFTDDDAVRFGVQILADTDVVPMSRAVRLLEGLREAYAGGSHEVLLEALSESHSDGGEAAVPRGLREVLEVLITSLNPGHQPHVDLIDQALATLGTRMDEQLIKCAGGGHLLPILAPRQSPQLSATRQPQFSSLDDRSTLMWQGDTEGPAAGSTTSIGFLQGSSGSIW